MKEKLGKRIFKNSVSFFFFIFLIEIILRINLSYSLIDWSVFRIFISSIFYSICLGIFSSIFKKNTNKIVNTIISFMLSLYAWIELNLHNYLGFFMGTGNAEQGTKVVDYIKEYIAAANLKSYLLLIPLGLYLVYIWFLDKKIKEYILNKTTCFTFKIETIKSKILTVLLYICILFVALLSYYGTLNIKFMQNDLQTINNKDLILTNDNPNLNVSQFGVYTFGFSDIVINTFNINVDISGEDIYNNNKKNNLVSNETLIRNIDDTSWNELINNESNSTYNKLNKYFINRNITPKNEKTGIYKDKNLIVILMESTNYIAIDKDRYPTIYKLWSEGTSFRNNYSPRNSCSTGNNEMTVMTSLYTINQTCTANRYKDNVYPESIFNMFNDLGYVTTSYHDYADHYYSRKTIHKNMGSSQYYNASDLGIKWSSLYKEWPSDTDLISSSVPHFINEDKFMVFLTSVTTHQPYVVESEFGDKNLDKLSDTDYPITIKRYMSKMYELDKALEMLLDELEKAGKLDDTVIALFGDHYPYGLQTSDISEVVGYDASINNEMDRTPMIIYNHGQEPEVVEDYTSLIDLLPTLLNMFDVDYDPRLYFGNDIFSDYDHKAYFADGSWQDEIGYYSASKGKFTPKDENNTYTNEEIININKEISTKQQMSALAIKNDYFNYLFKGLDKYKIINVEQTDESEE